MPRGRKGVEIVWIGKDMEVGDGVREIEDKEGKNRWIYKKNDDSLDFAGNREYDEVRYDEPE